MRNKIATLTVLVTVTGLFISPFVIEARGGGRGGGGGGRSGGGGGRATGAYSGGQVMNRTPTMSRAASSKPLSQAREQTPAGNVSQSRGQQSLQTNQQRLSNQIGQQRPTAANRAELRDQVNRYAQGSQAQNINRQSLSQGMQNFSGDRNIQNAQNQQLSNRVSQRVQQSQPGFNQWFDRSFFDRHNLDNNYATGTNLWRPAAWATLANWGAWDWATPYYYDNGNAYPITDTSGTTTSSYNTTPMQSYTTTPSQPTWPQPVQNTQTTQVEGDWLPLGIFAVSSQANAAAQTNRFLQLAINRNGEISGVLFNSATDAAQDLIGTVNSNTQMAYWSLANRPGAPVASTGIYNLTEDQTSINVRFSDGSNQTWTLVRLQQGQ